MQPFDDVLYPLALGRDAGVSPEFSTSVAVTASGHERRNSLWSDARLRFDVGPGIRSEAELGVLIAFFRARRGAARGFRLSDPFDHSSNGMTGTPTATDQVLGTGDGLTATFQLVKRYASGSQAWVRSITKPVAGSVRVALGGVEQASGWSVSTTTGLVTFATPPPSGVAVTAGFEFDVPVRFDSDVLEVTLDLERLGSITSIPLVEIRR